MTDKERQKRQMLYETRYKPAYDAFVKLYPFTLENLDGEQWADVVGYEGLYQVSTFGRIKSFKNRMHQIMKPLIHKKGYLTVTLTKDGKQKHHLVSRLVALSFIPNTDNLPQVDHIFGMKFDNSVDNLRWVTNAENTRYAFFQGLIGVGEDNYKAKLTNEQALYIRENPDSLSNVELARKFNVAEGLISAVQLGKVYKNVGGQIRKFRRCKYTQRLPDEIRAQIRSEYIPRSSEFSCYALAKKYGVNPQTICTIVHEK